MVPGSPGTQRLALPHAAARGRHGRANSRRDEAAPGFPVQRRAGESDPARERGGAGQPKPETGRKKPMREPTDLTREEYELTKVALERSDVPAEALALLSTWIEGEGLLVDDREDVGWMQGSWHRSLTSSPLFSPAVPTSAKPGNTPTGTASICSCTGMWRRAGSWCRYEGILPTLSLSRYSQRESRRWRRSTSGSARNSVMALVGDAVELLL